MSAKNKIENKKARKLARENKATRLAEFEPATDIPLDVSASVLVSPKEKLTRAARLVWHRSRDRVLKIARKQPLTDVEVQTKRFKLLSLAQVLRRRFQATRRAATASHVAKNLHESSKFRPAVVAEFHKHAARYSVAQTELARRGLVTQPA